MSKKVSVVSTLTSDVVFSIYVRQDENTTPVARESVLIRGGAGLREREGHDVKGPAVTEVDESRLEVLRADPVFAKMERDGWLTVVDGSADGEKVGADMSRGDGSSPDNESNLGRLNLDLTKEGVDASLSKGSRKR